MNHRNPFAILLVLVISMGVIGSSCKSYEEKEKALTDTRKRGMIYVSADESFKPVVDELVKVYESNNPGTKINVLYKPEAECLQDMLTDSIRVIIATRGFDKDEKKFIEDSLKVSPEMMTVARDGVAVILHPSVKNASFTMEDVKNILRGRSKENFVPVFDGLKATSTVRFIIDSVLRGDTLTSKAVGARSSEGVLEYVSKNPGAVGFVGVEWIGNPEDATQVSYLKKVKMAEIESTDIPGGYVKAYQANIHIKRYPMVRDLVYILKERHDGLGNGFTNFMSGEIGQLIFLRAYLAPAKQRFGMRPVRLKE